jgi:hypothetical protein
VEYELDVTTSTGPIPGTTETRTIGSATQAGNAFGFEWDIEDDIADQVNPPATVTYTLRALLYTGFTGPGTGVEVSRDEMEITINHQNDGNAQTKSDSDAAETVEMTYPVNGGPLGVLIRQDGSGGNFTIEAVVSQGSGDPDFGTQFVTPFYTISEFGEEPVWESCGGYSGTSNNDDGSRTARVRCATNAGDYALDVTGVALVANDTPEEVDIVNGPDPTFDDSADAHAVTPYFQRVNSVTLDPVTTNDQARAQCAQFVATALDQNSRPVGNVNIDVMAQGPSDQLKFDAYTGNGRVSDNQQVPDKNHPGNGEPAISCQNGNRLNSTGRQGEHNVPGGNDLKHIESVGGTDLGGEFEFALAADRDGGTQVMAYADENDDDLFCSEEKSASAAVGWNQGAPSPSGFPSEGSSCEVMTPSPTPTPTESPTDSPSNGTTSPPPEKERHDRDVTIKFAHGSLIVSGKVSVDDGTNKCRSNVNVQVQRRQNKRWKTKKTVQTNGAGNYSATLRDKPGKYRARAPKVRMGNDVCLLDTAVKRHRHR